MKAPRLITRIVLVLVATVVLALSAGMAWAAVNEYQARGIVAHGVSIAGEDLGGMTEAQVREVLAEKVSAPLLRPVIVDVDGKDYPFDPSGAITVDLDAMVDESFAPRRSASFIARLRHDLTGAPLTAEVSPVYSIDNVAVEQWLESVAKKTNRKPVSASVKVESPRVEIVPAAKGRRLETTPTAEAITAVFSADSILDAGERKVTASVTKTDPKVTEKEFEKVILVDLSERRVRLFKNGAIEKEYRCAIGTPDHPTPTGDFEITAKRYRPTWVNPAPDSWGKNMPASIAPGPGNPLGTRAINISASGIRFHGTENIGSVGTAASHGCMRMQRHDIEDLYERVEVGTKVYIRH